MLNAGMLEKRQHKSENNWSSVGENETGLMLLTSSTGRDPAPISEKCHHDHGPFKNRPRVIAETRREKMVEPRGHKNFGDLGEDC